MSPPLPACSTRSARVGFGDVEVRGGEALEAHLKKLAERVRGSGTLRVGFLEGATYPDGTSVATIAALENYGAPAAGIPARPFFSNMVRDKSPGWGAALARLLEQTDWNADEALALMGEGIAGQLREVIVAGGFAPNSPVTNLLKQRFPTGDDITFDDIQKARADIAAGETAPAGKPLVWSGHLLASIDSEVE